MTLAIIAGSGLGALADLVPAEGSVAFSSLEGVGACTVAGHAGEVREGAIDGRRCVLVLGRRHLYEGDSSPVDRLVDHVVERGATALLVTSAAGALRRSLQPGDMVVVRDLIDRQNRRQFPRPETGWGRNPHPRRMKIDTDLADRVERAAASAGVSWQRGTLLCGAGPAYETVAEVESLQRAGADVVTMSAAPEVARANHHRLPVAAVAIVTNPCTGIASASPSHGEVLEVGARAALELARVIRQLIISL